MTKTALCVGINDYPGTSADLSGCVNDVNDWKAALEPRGFTVTTLIDRDATKGNMVESLTKLFRDAASGDTVVFQYSGHGSFVADLDGDEPDGRDEVLCPSDIGSSVYLVDDELHELFGLAKPGVKIVFLSDSCHSGSVSRFRMADPDVDHGTKSRFLPPETFLRDFEMPGVAVASRGRRKRRAKAPRALLVSGCLDHQTSADAWFGGRANGAFSHYALRTLKQLPAGATYRQWHAAIRQHLPSVYFPQEPNLFASNAQANWKVFE